MLNRWMSASDESRNYETAMRHITERNQHTTASLQQVSYVLMVALGAVLVSDGMTTQGGLVACSILSGRVLGPGRDVALTAAAMGSCESSIKGS
jgi:ATP-binding cassette, subfamily C, bacterial LapB